jgi:hypothetical protein
LRQVFYISDSCIYADNRIQALRSYQGLSRTLQEIRYSLEQKGMSKV